MSGARQAGRTNGDAAGARPVTVEVVRRGPDPEVIRGFNLDDPSPDRPTSTYAFLLQGWVMGRRRPPVALELFRGEAAFAWLPVNASRPDIARLHPDVPWSSKTGFRVGVNTLRLPASFELEVVAVLEDESRARLATLKGTRRLPAGAAPSGDVQPLMLTTLGRSGSTWVSRLLGCHPAVVAFRPFEYETRVASYWTDMAAVISDPVSYAQVLRADFSGDVWWSGRGRQPPPPLQQIDQEMDGWLGRRHVEETIPFAMRQIEAFYRRVVEVEGRDDARFFVEKFDPGATSRFVLRDLYPGAREIVLVRDFRDMACSIFAYNEKRGVQSFGRQDLGSDEEYLGRLLRDGRRLLESWRERNGAAHLLRYEDLILRPEETLADVFRYLGVEHGPERVRDVMAEAHRLTPDLQAEHRTAASPEASIGRWRRDLPPALQAAADETFAGLLEDFGYPAAEPVSGART